jgi:hypothetical protein
MTTESTGEQPGAPRYNVAIDDEDQSLDARGDGVAPESWAARLGPLWSALIVAAPFAGVVAGSSEFFYDDHFRFSTPIAGMFAEAVRGHHLPLWNPWILTGTPLVAERGSMVAHPGMLLALVMEPSHAIGTLIVLLLAVLAAGSTALLRALGVRPVLAVGMGAAIGLSGPALSYTGNAPFLATLAFLPLVLRAALAIAAGQGSVFGAGLALGMALLGGDLPGALLCALLALVAFHAGGGRLRATWPRLASVAAIALVVGAGSWFPVVWALPLSERGAGIPAAEAGKWSFHPAELVGFLWPHPLGLPLPRFTFWPFRWMGERLFLHSVWMGAIVSAASWLALSRKAPRVARTFAVAALVLLLAATGASTPLWTILRPLFTFLRYPSKLAGPAALLLAFAGAVMVDRTLDRPRGLRLLGLWVAAIAALGALGGTALQSLLARRAEAPDEIVEAAARALRLDTARVALLAVAAALLGLLLERGRLSRGRATAGLALLLFLDGFATTADLVWTRAPVTAARPAYLPEVGRRGPRVMRLSEVHTARLALDDRAFSDEQLRHAALLRPMTNAFYATSVLDPYGLYLGEVAAAMAELAKRNPLALAEVTASDLVLAAPGSRAPWLLAALQSRELVPVATSPAGAVVLRPAHPWPRSFLVSAAAPAPGSEIPARLARDSRQVWLSRERVLRGGKLAAWDPGALPASILAASAAPVVAVAPVAWRPGAASYRVVVAAPALLVEIDAFTPGWRAYLDGREASILQANVFGRAVAVPPGSHVVEWRFSPPWVVASLLASWIGLPLGLLVLALRRRRRG